MMQPFNDTFSHFLDSKRERERGEGKVEKVGSIDT